MVAMAGTACGSSSSSDDESGGADASCAYTVVYDGHEYSDGYVIDGLQYETARPGRVIGEGTEVSCSDDDFRRPVTVRTIRGVPPAEGIWLPPVVAGTEPVGPAGVTPPGVE